MPLEKQVVGVNFTQGLDTQTDKRVVLPGKMVALQNATMSEADTFKRRNGNTSLATGTAFSGLAAHGQQLLAIDSGTIKSYSPAANSPISGGAISTITLAKDELVHTTGAQDLYDVATLNGYTCYVWRDYLADGTLNGVKYQILDETSGAVVVLPTILNATGYSPRVIAFSNSFILLYGGAATTINARVVATSAPTVLGAETALINDFSAATPVMDACALTSAGYVYYVSSATTTASTRVFSISVSGTTPSVAAGPTAITLDASASRANAIGVAIASFSASLLGVYLLVNSAGTGPGLWGGVITSAAAVSVASALKDATAAPTGNYGAITAVLSGSTMWVYSDDAGSIGGAAATKLIRRSGINSSNTVTTGPATWALSAIRANGTNGPFIASKAFLAGGTVYIPMFVQEAGTGALQNSWFLLNESTVPVARALYGSWGVVPSGFGSTNWMQASAPALASGEVVVMVREIDLLSFATGTNVSPTGLNRLRVSVNATTPLIRQQIGRLTYFANGILSAWDNGASTEAAFNLFPEVVSAAQGAAGGVVTAGVHGLVALYEWFDATGQRHQSAPSVAIQYTAADSTHHCTVTVPTLFLSQKTGITIGVYATTAGGTIYYRVNPISAPAANSTTAATIAVDFNIADASLTAGELLYTTGDILPNNGPPPCSVLAVHQNRVFINPSDDPFSYQYSQPCVSGFGVQWNEALRGRVESTGGTVAAFASIDDKLIVFRPRKIGVLFGQGPSTTGALNGYQLQDLPTDVGCSEPRSVLVMPEGVIFKSTSKGWYRLGRDLQLTWIGEGVQQWDAQGVTSAVLLDTLKECRFTTNDAEGLTLVWHYQRQQWSTFSSFTAVDAVWWPGGNAYIRATATKLIKELPPTAAGLAYGDLATTATGAIGGTAPVAQTGSVIPMTFRTGWLKPGDALQAFQRIWRVLLTGAAAGHPPPYTTLTADFTAGLDTFFTVADTSAFANDDQGVGPAINLGSSTYETSSNGYTITSPTILTPVVAGDYTQNHFIGEGVWGSAPTAAGAAGSMVVKFYFDGNDSAAYQTITISDVSALVSGNAWNVRFQPNLQKCNAIMMEVVSTPAVQDPGASLNFSGMTLELGVKRGARKFNAAQTK